MDYEKMWNELFEYVKERKLRAPNTIEHNAYNNVMLKIWELTDAEKERTKDGD